MNYDGKIRIGTELETKDFEAQYKSLENKLNIMIKTLESENKIPIQFRMNESERLELEANIEKTKNQLISLKEKIEDVGNKGTSTGDKISKSFNKGTSNLKRFAFSLFGVGSIFATVSKASNAYLSQNTELANKLQSVWTGLGTFLAPAIEFISDTLLKGLGYLNEFIKALTGIDFIANANAKALKKQADAQKNLNNQTYAFDEMNIEQNTSNFNSSVSSSNSGLINIPELDQGIINKLQEMAKWLKENWDWLSKVGIALGVVFGISKISGWIKNIGTLIGTKGTGILGLSTILKTIGTIGAVALGVNLFYSALTGRDLVADLKEIYDYFSKIGKLNEANTKNSKKNISENKKWIDSKKEEIKKWQKGTNEANLYFNQLLQLTNASASDNKVMAQRVKEMSGLEYWYAKLDGTVDEYNERLKDNFDAMRNSIQGMADMYEQGLLTEEQEKRFFEILQSVNGELINGQVQFKNLNHDIYNASKHTSDYNKIVNATGNELESSKNKTQGFIDKTKELAKKLSDMSKENYTVKQTVKTEFTVDTNKIQTALNKIGLNSFANIFQGVGVALSNIKMATGGIVNNPGRGVPIGYNVISGEAGREGVLPLTDSGTMAELGYEIGKWITVKATLNNYMNGRLFQRQISEMNKDHEFATNGRG